MTFVGDVAALLVEPDAKGLHLFHRIINGAPIPDALRSLSTLTDGRHVTGVVRRLQRHSDHGLAVVR